ncbi:MAG: hypothetical protein ACSLFN_13475 [Candidatus Limnocylindrales bacterium]
MHDSRLEDQLRNALRAEGDGQPLTITPAELERRLLLRRRARNSQRFSLVAAAVAVVAIGSIVAIGNGWLGMPAVGVDPSPSPTASGSLGPAETTAAPAPTRVPSSTSQPTPRAANPLGDGTQAILVRPTGADLTRPDTFVVFRVDPTTGVSTPIATIPGGILPADGSIDEFGATAPAISTTGRLAIPFRRGSTEETTTPALALVDVRAPDADPWILDGFEAASWNEVDVLYARRGDEIWQVRVGDRYMARLPFDVGVRAMPAGSSGANAPFGPAVAHEDGTRLLGRDGDTPGAIGFDGTFTPTADLPSVFQRTGLERPAGDGAHTLGEACDSGATAESSGCFLIETDPTGEPATEWLRYEAAPRLHDFAWGADGESVWMLFDGDANGSDAVGPHQVVLAFADTPGSPTDVGRIDFQSGSDSPALLGIIGEEPRGTAAAIALGTRQGLLRAILVDSRQVYSFAGTAWFAGWAVDPAAYDPD